MTYGPCKKRSQGLGIAISNGEIGERESERLPIASLATTLTIDGTSQNGVRDEIAAV